MIGLFPFRNYTAGLKIQEFNPKYDFLSHTVFLHNICGASFVDIFFYLCFMFIFAMLYCLFLAALWLPAGKGLASWPSCVLCFLVFVSFQFGVSDQVWYLILSHNYKWYNVWTICFLAIWYRNSKWVRSGNTTITNRRQTHDTSKNSHTVSKRNQEDKLHKATSSLFPFKMIAKLKWT